MKDEDESVTFLTSIDDGPLEDGVDSLFEDYFKGDIPEDELSEELEEVLIEAFFYGALWILSIVMTGRDIHGNPVNASVIDLWNESLQSLKEGYGQIIQESQTQENQPLRQRITEAYTVRKAKTKISTDLYSKSNKDQ